MRRYLLLAFIPLAALVGCQREPSPEDLHMQEVKTQFVFNISGHRTPSTKQSARATQADGNFRGIDRGKLFAYVLPQDGQYLKTDATATKAYDLSRFMNSAEASAFSSRRILEMMLPLGTNTLLFYGRGASTAVPEGSGFSQADYFGKLDAYDITEDVGSANFKLGKRLEKESHFKMTENLIAGILTVIMNTTIKNGAHFDATQIPGGTGSLPPYGFDITLTKDISWADYAGDESPYDGEDSDPLEEKLSYLYKQMTTIHTGDGELRAGSTEAVLKIVTDLWSVINSVRWAIPTSEAEAVAKFFAQTVNVHIGQYFSGTLATEGGSATEVSFNALKDTQTDPVVYGIIHYIVADAFWPANVPAMYQVTETALNALDATVITSFPSYFNIPRGASYMAFNTEGKYFYYPQEFNVSAFDGQPKDETDANTVTYNAGNYYYPAELLYFGNSPIRVSDQEHKTGDYPNTATDWMDDTNWPASVSGQSGTKDWESDKHVLSSTRSVAMKHNIHYGVSMLETRVGYSDAVISSHELLDNNHYVQHVTNGIALNSQDEPDKKIVVTDGSFKLTGIIIGGQTQNVDWDFLPAKDPTENKLVTGFIYDKAITAESANILLNDGSTFTPNYTVVFDNYNKAEADKGTEGKQDKVYVALEFQNNTGQDFYGNFNLIRNGGYFYLIAEMDPAGKTVTWPTDGYRIPPYDKEVPRIFIQDYVTKATFKFDTHSLKYAYLTVPDLRASSLTLGLSVDIHWNDGMVYDDLIMGGGQPDYNNGN